MHGLHTKNIDLEKECLKMEDELRGFEDQIGSMVRLIEGLFSIYRHRRKIKG